MNFHSELQMYNPTKCTWNDLNATGLHCKAHCTHIYKTPFPKGKYEKFPTIPFHCIIPSFTIGFKILRPFKYPLSSGCDCVAKLKNFFLVRKWIQLQHNCGNWAIVKEENHKNFRLDENWISTLRFALRTNEVMNALKLN